MAIDKGKTLDQLMAEIQADLQTEKQRQASRPRLSLPEIPTGQVSTTQEQQDVIDKYLNARSPLGSFLGNTLSTIAFPLNYGVLQPLGEYTDFGRWTDPNKDFLDKVAFNPFSKANELLAEGWEKDGFFGAVGELAEKGKTGGDVVAGLSSTLGYGLSRAIGSDTEEDKAFDLKYWQERQKKFKEENKAAYYGGGFGVELLTDPLNALTFGGASAVKAGASAALKEANKVAKSAGVSGKFKTVEDAVDAVYNKTVDKYTKMQPQTKALQTPASQTVTKNIDAEINRIKQAAIKKGIDPDKAQKLATQAVKSSEEPAQVVSRIDKLATEARQRAIAQIDNAARSARAKAQNRLISLDIPLTNKTVGLVNKPAFMARTADKVGERAVSVVANLTKLLEPPSANTPEALASAARVAEDRMSELLQTRYGVTKAEDLTIDAIRDLEDLFESSQRRTKELGFQTKVDEELIPEMKVAKVEDALRNVDPKVVQAIDNLLGQGYKIDEVDQIIGDARTAYNIDKDTLEILPELIRAEAKQLGMPTITPTPKPVPKSIINKFDQLFETSTKLGLENRAYDKAFTDLVDEFNSGKITKEDLLKKVDADLKSVKELVKEQKKTAKPKPTRKKKEVPSETPQVKQKTTEPSNVITPEKKKYFEMLRSTLQPTGIPQVVQGMDKEFVKQMEQVAKRLEEMKPIRILDDQKQLKRKELALTPVLDAEGKAKKIAVPVQKVQTKKVKGETVYVTSGRDYVPFEKLRKMPEFVQDMGGNTPIGRWYRSTLLSRVFSARSLGLGDTFVNSYGDLIQQAKTMKAGELNFMQRDLVKLSKIAEGLTNDELLAAQYLVENRFPKAFSDAQIETLKKNEKLSELVDTIKNLMAYVGKEEQAAGLLGKLRDDYFPHVMKFNNTKWDDFVKKYEDDKDLGGLIGKSQANSFTKQRTGLPTLAELDDALASLQTKLEDATNEKAIKGLSGKIKELEEMFNRNTLQAVASRVYTSARSRAMRQLYTQMRKDRLLRYTVPSLKPEDFVRITREEADALGFPKLREGASILYIQKDLMDALKRTEDIFTDDRLTEGIKTIDDVMKIWRLSTTVMIPKHYVNNLIGNVFNNMLAGVNPAEYKNAAKVLSDMRKGKLSTSDQELVKQAYRDGIIGQGHNVEFDIFADPTKIKTWAQRTNEKIRSWGYTRALMYAGQWIDDTSRLALYMDSLKKTRSPKIAADRVREYLFNYHEVTHADKLVRSLLMPFWLWTKNNLPLQMKNLFTNPRVYVLAENIRRATFDDQDFADDPEFIREKYIQNFLGQKVPFSLPMYDVNKIEGFTGTLSNFASDLGPIPFRVPIELAANKEFFSNAKIYKEGKMNEDEKTASIVAYLTKALGGQVGSWVVDTYKKVIKDDKLTPEEQIARITSSYLYGMPYYEK